VGARAVQVSVYANGTGSVGEVLWIKSFIFRPPLDKEFRWAKYGAKDTNSSFFGRMTPGQRASNIYKLTNGTYTTIVTRDSTPVEKVYHGGHENFVTAEEKAELISAGYGDYVT
jgi:hypothetical protein